MTELILNVEELNKMGLNGQEFYLVEYDLNSRRLIPQDYKACPKCDSHTENLKTGFCQKCGADISTASIKSPITEQDKEERVRYNKVANEIRNKMFFALKFRIMATKHLESAWLVSKERLSSAVAELDAIKAEMKVGGFDNVDKRIRIVPILTTEEGAENFEETKIAFLLQFCSEHLAYCDDGLANQRIAKSTVWRCVKTYEIINVLADELKTEDAKHEVRDMAELLSDKISQVQAMLEKQAEEIKAGQ